MKIKYKNYNILPIIFSNSHLTITKGEFSTSKAFLLSSNVSLTYPERMTREDAGRPEMGLSIPRRGP